MVYAVRVVNEKQHDAAWRLFEYALNKEYGVKLKECSVVKNEFGKPRLLEYPDIYFSISHCKETAVCILSSSEVGIDVETVGRKCSKGVWERVLSDDEYEKIINTDFIGEGAEYNGAECTDAVYAENERNLLFLKYWTLKESYGKAMGKGMSYDWKSVSFSVDENNIVCNMPGYKFFQITVNCGGKDIVIAICRKQKEDFCEDVLWFEK